MEQAHAGKLAYLVAQYPAINHGFMLREVRELRRTGWKIASFSVRPPDRGAKDLSPDERSELSQTRYLKSAKGEALKAAAAYLLSRPLDLLGALRYAAAQGHQDPSSIVRRMFHLGEAILLGHWMREAGMKHVHSHYASMVTLFMHRLYPELSFSLTVHGPDEVQDPVQFAMQEKLRRAHLTVAISYYAQSQLMRFSEPGDWDRLEVAYLGTPVVDEVARPEPAPGEPLRFVCVGRLSPVKGQHVLIHAAKLLKSQGHNFKVSIAGAGPSAVSLQRAVAEAGVSDCVVLEGRVPDDQLARLYRESHAFVLPSFAEGLPGVLMEAMITGLPCITTGINGVPELIEHGIDGILVPPSDPAALANAMARMIGDARLRRELGQAGRRKVLANFNLETNVARLADLFRRRLADRVMN